jgi:hypothetical protein
LEPEAAPAGTARHVMGRLKTSASRKELRGHVVRARTGGRLLDSTTTDSAGRFLLRWDAVGDEKITAIELLGAGVVVETIELAAADLVSPPVVGFSGKDVIGFGGAEMENGRGMVFEADGDSPLCVTSSCIEVTLSWAVQPGTKVSLLSGEEVIREGLEAHGSLKVIEEDIKKYTLRTWSPGAQPGDVSDRIVELRRYPSLSLVMGGTRFGSGSTVDFGASISCPAGDGGLEVTVLTSDPELVPGTELKIPAGSTWASTKVRLGDKSGTAKITATAPGYVRDGVTFVVE